ncbi:MAG: hypothetical protein ACM34H_07270 [Deltaproteobacteria bacterium]
MKDDAHGLPRAGEKGGSPDFEGRHTVFTAGAETRRHCRSQEGFRLEDLENHQVRRSRDGLAPKTIDDEIRYVKTMVFKAYDNDRISGDVLKPFRKVGTLLKANADGRNKVISPSEFEAILQERVARTLTKPSFEGAN